MDILPNPPDFSPSHPPESLEDAVLAMLAGGACDAVALERAAAVAAETGFSRPNALVRLGLVSERTLAEVFGAVHGLKLAGPARYPAEPVFSARLRPRFLRAARAVPVAVEDGCLVLVMADPGDEFTPRAARLAAGLPVRVEIGVPA